MSPAKRGGKARRGSTRRTKGGGALKIVFALLVAAAAGMAGLAMYFGFVPGPWAGRAKLTDSLALDTAGVGAPAAAPGLLGPPDSTRPVVASDSAASTTPVATARSITIADSAAGDALYRGAGRCVGCHGAVGEGAAALGPNLRDAEWTSGDGSVAGIERVIANGVSAGGAYRIAMPAYASQLAMADIGRVAAYVYTLSHPGSVATDTLPTPAEAGNVDAAPTAGSGGTTGGVARVARPTVPPPPTPLPAPRRP